MEDVTVYWDRNIPYNLGEKAERLVIEMFNGVNYAIWAQCLPRGADRAE